MYKAAPRLPPGRRTDASGDNFDTQQAKTREGPPGGWGEEKIGFENLRLKKKTQLHWKFSVSLRNTTRFGPKKKKRISEEKNQGLVL